MSDYDNYEGPLPITTLPYDPGQDNPIQPEPYVPEPDKEPGGSTVGFPKLPDGSIDFEKWLKTLLGVVGGAGSAAGSVLNSDLGRILAAIFTGVNQSGQRRDAAKDITNAVDKNNVLISDAVKTSNANYAPYMAAGTGALGKMTSQPQSDLASRFVSTSDKSNLAPRFSSGMVPLSSITGK